MARSNLTAQTRRTRKFEDDLLVKLAEHDGALDTLEAGGNVGTADLADGAVTTAKIADANVTAAKLATDAVETAKIKDANVTAAKLATDAVETLKIKDANVTAAKLATDAVETAKIKDANVTTSKLATNAVTTLKITDANVTAEKLATDAVETAKIKDLNVTTAKLAAAAVTAAKRAIYLSAERTATGAEETIAHGLSGVPTRVRVYITHHPGTPDTGAFTISEGAHDGTSLFVTVTLNCKYKIEAEL